MSYVRRPSILFVCNLAVVLLLGACGSKGSSGGEAPSEPKAEKSKKASKAAAKPEPESKKAKSDPDLTDEVDLAAKTWTFRLFGDEEVFKLVELDLGKCGLTGVRIPFAEKAVVWGTKNVLGAGPTTAPCTVGNGLGAPGVETMVHVPAELTIRLIAGETDPAAYIEKKKKEVQKESTFVRTHDEAKDGFVLEAKDITGATGMWGIAAVKIDGHVLECRTHAGGAPSKIDHARAVLEVCKAMRGSGALGAMAAATEAEPPKKAAEPTAALPGPTGGVPKKAVKVPCTCAKNDSLCLMKCGAT